MELQVDELVVAAVRWPHVGNTMLIGLNKLYVRRGYRGF